jgi:hypothetical protein
VASFNKIWVNARSGVNRCGGHGQISPAFFYFFVNAASTLFVGAFAG